MYRKVDLGMRSRDIDYPYVDLQWVPWQTLNSNKDSYKLGASVIKFWGPRENRDPGSLFSYEHGDSLMNLGTPQLYDA